MTTDHDSGTFGDTGLSDPPTDAPISLTGAQDTGADMEPDAPPPPPPTFRPRNDNVLVLVDGAKERQGRLYIPANAVKVPSRGTIVAVGPGYLLADGSRGQLDLNEGDRVEFLMHPGMHQIDLGGETHYVMKETDILGFIENEPMPEMAAPGGDDAAVDESAAGTSTQDNARPSPIIIASR